MDAFAYLVCVLLLATGLGLLTQLLASTLQRPVPRLSLGLYRAAGLRHRPENRVSGVIGFTALFFVTGLLHYWLGAPAGLLLLLWVSYQLLQAAASPLEGKHQE